MLEVLFSTKFECIFENFIPTPYQAPSVKSEKGAYFW